MNPRSDFRPRQAGYSLAEILVGVAVFALIFIAALMVYDRSNVAFRRGVEAADTQQNTRVAFDRLVAEIRMAGFDHDRDGIPTATGGTVWQPNRAYGIGNIISPTIANGFVYRCSAVTGSSPYTSGASEPSWPVPPAGPDVTDNEITWSRQTGINQYQQPDEQIEFAGPTAITIRANFDFEIDVVNENGREPVLQTAQFPVVTTGNDEIATYALRKYDSAGNAPAALNPDSVAVCMDVQVPPNPPRFAHPGGLPERCFNIPSVDLSPDNPPYTLVRITLNDAGAPVYTPVANNIRRMDFQYFNNFTGTPSVPVPTGWNSAAVTVEGFTHPPGTQLLNPGGGQYSPTNPALGVAERAARMLIKSVRLSLVGMDAEPDLAYTNPAEAPASAALNYRTYRVESLIVPRNLGKQGMREQQAAAPGRPVLQSVCVGWCGVAQVNWLAPAPNPNFGQVEQYIIQYGTTSGGPYPSTKQVGTATTGFVTGLTPATTYYFTVSAVNSYGTSPAQDTVGSASPDVPDEVPGTPLNRTTPEPPSSIAATNGATAQNNRILVTWNAPVANISPDNYVQCQTPAGSISTVSPVNVAPGEITHYRVHRSVDPNFTAGSTNLIPTSGRNSITFGVGTVSFTDRSAVNCVNYYYRIQAREECDLAAENVSPAVGWSTVAPSSNPSTVMGNSTAAAPPAQPAPLKVSAGVTCNPVKCDAKLDWLKVTKDTASPAPNTIVIRDYRVTRQRRRVQLDAFGNPVTDGFGNYVMEDDPTGLVTYTVQDPAPLTGQGVTYTDPMLDLKDANSRPYEYDFSVKALQCGLESLPSLEGRFPCTFGGTVLGVVISGNPPLDGDGLTRGTAWLVQSPGSAITLDGTGIQEVQAYLNDGVNVIPLGVDTTSTYDFPIVGAEDGVVYAAELIVRDTNNCLLIINRYVEESTPSGCCLSPSASDPLVVNYSPGTTLVEVFLRNLCSDPLDIQEALTDSIRIGWSSAGNTLASVVFPASTGTVTQTLNDTTGSVLFSPPAGFLDPVPAESTTYKLVLSFNVALTGATHPITSFCITYRRPGVDTTDQICKFIPEPSVLNTCL